MTTVALSSRPALGASATPKLRLTTRGRRLLGVLAAGAVASVIALGTGAFAGPSEIPAVVTTPHTFVAGESLWSVASTLAGPGQDVREIIDQLMELNALDSAAVQAGQTIQVPTR